MSLTVYTSDGRRKDSGKTGTTVALARFESTAGAAAGANIPWNLQIHNSDPAAIYRAASDQSIVVRDAGYYSFDCQTLSSSGQADSRFDMRVSAYDAAGNVLEQFNSMSRAIGGYSRNHISQVQYLPAGGYLRVNQDPASYNNTDWNFLSIVKLATQIPVVQTVTTTVASSRAATAREGEQHFASDTGVLSQFINGAWREIDFRYVTGSVSMNTGYDLAPISENQIYDVAVFNQVSGGTYWGGKIYYNASNGVGTLGTGNNINWSRTGGGMLRMNSANGVGYQMEIAYKRIK